MVTLSTVEPLAPKEESDKAHLVGVGKERSADFVDVVRLVGKRLNLRRTEARMSVRDLSRASGVNINTISKIERGKQKELTAWAFFALCEALRIDPLLAWYGETRKPEEGRASRRSEPPPPASSRRPTPIPPKSTPPKR